MAVAEKSLTVRMTEITRKNNRLRRKFCVYGLRSKISGGFRGGGMGGDGHPPHQPKHNVHMHNIKH